MMFIIFLAGSEGPAELRPTHTNTSESGLMLCFSFITNACVFMCLWKKGFLFVLFFFFSGANKCIMGIPVLLELSGTQCLFVVMVLLLPAVAVSFIFT